MQNDDGGNSVSDANADGWTPRIDCDVLTAECLESAALPSQTFVTDYAMTMPPSQPYDLALEPHAHAIREFLDRYYRTLEDAPHDAWRQYSVAAQYVHVDVDPNANGHGYGNSRPAVGHREIRVNVVHQRFAECRFSVRTMDVQRVPSGDYVALVTGDMCRQNCPPQAFVQTFVVGCGGVSFDQWAISNSLLLVNYFRQ